MGVFFVCFYIYHSIMQSLLSVPYKKMTAASICFGAIGAYMNHVTALAATSERVATLSLCGTGFTAFCLTF